MKVVIDFKLILDFARSFFSAIGVLFAMQQLAAICPNFRNECEVHSGNYIFGILILALLWAVSIFIFKSVKYIDKKLNIPETSLEIKYGDLFDEQKHLVIGFSDCFDTEIGEIISANSLQGQFEEKFYKDNIQALDEEINQEIAARRLEHIDKIEKIMGKQKAYPIGTTIALGNPNRRFFLCAYTEMDNRCVVQSDAEKLDKSLVALWEEIRVKGQGHPVSMTLIGSDLARTGIDRLFLLSKIILSFIVNSQKRFICQKLTIVLHNKDKDKVDFQRLRELIDIWTSI